ncbi:MAG: lipid-A-disaccharide synthase [Candidatus Omnitrophica bacterium]|nr:lipid-A-disaccharide synthase [Candidatus Omnitrophota bacterium]
MADQQKHFIIVAGEASGDMHAAHLVEAMRRLDPSITFSGLGGPQMESLGVRLYFDMTKIAVVGFVEVLKHYKKFKEIFTLILQKCDEIKPAAVILVDYPGFNLRLAVELKKRNIKVIYYISPQVWAWKKNRVYTIQKSVDKMLVLFQFEKDFYAKFGIDVDFVGHPLVDIVKTSQPKEQFLSSLNLNPKELTIGLLPGSRQKEIETLLPVMLDASRILLNKHPKAQFLLIKAPTIERPLLEKYLEKFPIKLSIIEQATYDGINACDFCMVASGTATLETAILEKPMVVVYKTSLLTWILAKLLVKIPNIGLVNVVAGKRVVPECIQFQATGKNIAEEIERFIIDENKTSLIKEELKKVRKSLGAGGSGSNAALRILGLDR